MPRHTRAFVVVLLLTILVSAGSVADTAQVRPLRLTAGTRLPEPAETEQHLERIQAAGTDRDGAIIQFEQIPTATDRLSLAARGITLHRYIQENAYIATLPADFRADETGNYGITWIGALQPQEKFPEGLQVAGTPEWCLDESGRPQFSISVFPHIEPEAAAVWLAAEYGAVALGVSRLANAVAVALPADNWFDIAHDSRVLTVEPFWPRRETNNSCRTNSRAEEAQTAPYNLDGSGIMVGEWDGGRADINHSDFGGRVVSGDAASFMTHATHVAGTILGDGSESGGTYRGMAPAAGLVTYLWWNFAFEMENETQSAINTHDIWASNNSWGVGYSPPTVSNCNAYLGNYFSECGAIDDVVRGDLGKPVINVWSAGNERLNSPDYCGSVGFTWGTIIPYGTSKNALTIGAINSNNSTMTSFSSWGPTDDGRLKPEIVAPGCQTGADFGVTSTKLTSGYTVYCGTSMAAPTTTGCVALWLERFNDLHPGDVPLASTVRAMFCETAFDLGSTGPEYDFGYGRLDIVAAVDRLDDGAFLEASVDHGETPQWTFVSDGSVTPMSITLAWDDPGAFAGANPTLINDLDLRLISPGGATTYLPWVLNPANPSADATTGLDRRNNIEQVRITGPLPAGIWTIDVEGFNVPQGPQDFSLVYSAAIDLSSGPQDYAVTVAADNDTTSIPADLPFSILVANIGAQNDTYDVTLNSSHGWTITPNPVTVSILSLDDSLLSFTVAIPVSGPFNVNDTITGTAVSQADPGVNSSDQKIVAVISGRAVAAVAANDTLGIAGKTIESAATVTNTGFFADDIDWSLTDQQGWGVSPPGGTSSLAPGEDDTLGLEFTIDPGALAGSTNWVKVNAVSQADPGAAAADSLRVTVLDDPPVPLLVAPADGAPINNATPTLEWGKGAYVPYPPPYDVFAFAVEIADDPAFTANLVHLDALNDSSVTSSALADGVHYWRVLSYNVFGDSSAYSEIRAFEVDTQAPDVPSLLSPADSAYEADITPTFAWSAVTAKSLSSPVVYRWEISADSTFASDVDSLWTSVTTYTLPDSTPLEQCSTVVYWRVTARDDAGNWSAPSPSHSYAVYIPGDMNFDCVGDVFDVVLLIGVVFRAEPLPNPPGRAECNCSPPPPDVFDAVALVDYVFRAGPPPCTPL